MRLEIQHIAPIRAANIIATIYFIMFALFALPMLLLSESMPMHPNVDPAQQQTFARGMRGMLIAYPFLGAFFGWIFSALGAVIFNWLTPRLGGFVLEVDESRPATL